MAYSKKQTAKRYHSVSETIIPQGYKITIGRRRTHITTYENLRLQTTKPIKENKPQQLKPSVPEQIVSEPSKYADYNYYLRNQKRRERIRELSYNSFEFEHSVAITLTFAQTMTNLDEAHYFFKKFIQRVNSHYDGFRYLATFSRQTNGNWHYHMLCNFKPATKNENVAEIWKHGFTYITKFDKQAKFDTAVQYLINNMTSEGNEKRGKHGYLASSNLERNIVLTSYKEQDQEQFDEAFQKILESNRRILYESHFHLGIQGETVDTDTGEIHTYTIPDEELTPMLENAGYKSFDSIFTHITSAARFDEKFGLIQAATPKQKKFKHRVRPISVPSVTDASQ